MNTYINKKRNSTILFGSVSFIFLVFIHSCSFFKSEDQRRLETAELLLFRPVVSGTNQYRYQSDYRGPLKPGDKFDLSFGRNNRDEARFKLMLVGAQTDSMSIRAVDKGPVKRECVIERVENRKGCVIKVKSDGRHFLVSIKREIFTKNTPVELYIFAESKTPISFYRERNLLKK